MNPLKLLQDGIEKFVGIPNPEYVDPSVHNTVSARPFDLRVAGEKVNEALGHMLDAETKVSKLALGNQVLLGRVTEPVPNIKNDPSEESSYTKRSDRVSVARERIKGIPGKTVPYNLVHRESIDDYDLAA